MVDLPRDPLSNSFDCLVDLPANLRLHVHESCHVHEHGCVLGTLPSAFADGACDGERADCFEQGRWQSLLAEVDGNVVLLVFGRHPARLRLLVERVGDGPREWEAAFSAFFGHASEDSQGTDIVGWRREVDDKGLREEVGALDLRGALPMDEDVGEGSGRVSHVSLHREGMQYLPDQTVDRLGLMLLVRGPIFIEHLLAGVH